MQTLSGEETPREALGTFGDYIGGVLNPFLAFASFIALLYTLKLNQEELNETRKELKRAADAQEDSKHLRNEQLKTQFLQQFDSFFSMLLNQLHHKIEMIRQDQVLDQLHQNMEKDLSKDEIWYVQELKNLFNFVYLILEAVNSNIGTSHMFEDPEKMRLKNKYWSITRSMLPEKVMHLMMKDCIDYQDDPKIQRYKPLIEQARFFENISFYGLTANQKFWLIWASAKFESQVFGENHGYQQLKDTLPYQLIQQVNIKDLESFLFKILHQNEQAEFLVLDQQKIFNLELKEEITLVFDFTKNPYNPDIQYIGLPLSEINLYTDALALKFHDEQQVEQNSILFIYFKMSRHQISIDRYSI